MTKALVKLVHLKVHIKTVHEGVREHTCHICGKTLSQADHLNLHIKTLHEGVREHACQVCDKSFAEGPPPPDFRFNQLIALPQQVGG